MGKPSINAKTVLAEIRSGFTPDALMKKYALSPKGLQSLLTKLVSAGAIGQSELDAWKAKGHEPITATDDLEIVTERRGAVEGDESRSPRRTGDVRVTPPDSVHRPRVSQSRAPQSVLTVSIDADMEVVTDGAASEGPGRQTRAPGSQARPAARRVESRPKLGGSAHTPQAPLSVAVSIGGDMEVVSAGMTGPEPDGDQSPGSSSPARATTCAPVSGHAPRRSGSGGLETIAITDGLHAVVEGSDDTLKSTRDDSMETDAPLTQGRGLAPFGDAKSPIQFTAPLLKGAPVISVAAGMELVAEGSTRFEDEGPAQDDSGSGGARRRERWSQPGAVVPRPPAIAATGLSVTEGMEIDTDGLEIEDDDASSESQAGNARSPRGPSYSRRRLSGATGDFEAEASEFDGIDATDEVTRPTDATERVGADEPRADAESEGPGEDASDEGGEEDYGDDFDEKRRARRRKRPAPLRPLPPPPEGAAVRAAAEGDAADRRFAHRKRWYDYGLVVFLLMFIPFSAPLAFIHGPALFTYAYGFIYPGATAPEADPRVFLAPFGLSLLLGWFALLRNTEMAAWVKVCFVTLWLVSAPAVWFMIPRSSAAADAILKELNAKGDHCVARLVGWRQNTLRVDFTHKTGAASRDKIVDKVRFMRNELYEDGVRYLEVPDSTGNYLRIDFDSMTESLTTEKALPWFQPSSARR